MGSFIYILHRNANTNLIQTQKQKKAKKLSNIIKYDFCLIVDSS
jgi:hypothetical protein